MKEAALPFQGRNLGTPEPVRGPATAYHPGAAPSIMPARWHTFLGRDSIVRHRAAIVALTLFVNLCIAASVIPMRGSLSNVSTPEALVSNWVLNILPVALLLWWSRGIPNNGLPNVGILLSVVATFAFVNVLNFGTSSRLTACTLFLALAILALLRPAFLASATYQLVRWAAYVAVAFGGMVTVLNLPNLTPTFLYDKGAPVEELVYLPFRNPNLLCVQLDIVVPLVVAMMVLMPSRRRIAIGLACLVWLSNLVLATRSRGGLAQLILMWSIATLFLTRKIGPRTRILIVMAVLAIFLIVGRSTWAGYLGEEADILAERYELSERTLNQRDVTLDAVLQILESPRLLFFGKGAGNGGFAAAYTTDTPDMFSSHNSYVDTVAQFGLAFSVLLVLAIAGVYFRVRPRRGEPPQRRYLFWIWMAMHLHPMSEAVFFFRFGVTADLMRLGIFALAIVGPERIASVWGPSAVARSPSPTRGAGTWLPVAGTSGHIVGQRQEGLFRGQRAGCDDI